MKSSDSSARRTPKGSQSLLQHFPNRENPGCSSSKPHQSQTMIDGVMFYLMSNQPLMPKCKSESKSDVSKSKSYKDQSLKPHKIHKNDLSPAWILHPDRCCFCSVELQYPAHLSKTKSFATPRKPQLNSKPSSKILQTFLLRCSH